MNLGETTTALLLGNNLANVTYSSAAAALSSFLFSDSPVSRSAWEIGAACVILLFGEFTPKLLCTTRPLRRMLLLAPAWSAFAGVFVPVGSLVQRIIGRFIPRHEHDDKITTDMLLKALSDRGCGVMLSNFSTSLIRHILVSRSEGAAVTPGTLLATLDKVCYGQSADRHVIQAEQDVVRHASAKACGHPNR